MMNRHMLHKTQAFDQKAHGSMKDRIVFFEKAVRPPDGIVGLAQKVLGSGRLHLERF